MQTTQLVETDEGTESQGQGTASIPCRPRRTTIPKDRCVGVELVKSEQVWDGVPFETSGSTVRLICCDCGLSHDFTIVKRPRKRGYRITVRRNERSTAAVRRHMKKGE